MNVSPCSTSSYYPCGEGAWNMIFCIKFYSCFFVATIQCGPEGVCRYCRKLLWSSSYIQGRSCNNQAAMGVSHCSTASHFLCGKGAQNLIFYMKSERYFWKKWHGLNHIRVVDAAKGSSNNTHTSEEGYNTSKQQLMSLITVQNPISVWRGALNLTLFYMKFER